MPLSQMIMLDVESDVTDPRVLELTRRMSAYYSTVDAYPAFQDSPDNTRWHALLEQVISRALTQRKHGSDAKIKVLEFGAGRSTMPQSLSKYRDVVEFHAQDVTEINKAHLEQLFDRVYLVPIEQIPLRERYDIVFSTFVVEHIANPPLLFADIARRLSDGGRHLVICPRYDLPIYICPSLRHMSRWRILLEQVRGAVGRLKRPAFQINAAPAALSVPYFRDSDALHVVRARPIRHWHRVHGFEREGLLCRTNGLRDALFVKGLLLVDCYRKKAG